MDEPNSLDSLFKEKIFRIPDYQRGYAWQKKQLTEFWEDLINLGNGKSHYTGVLTLKEIASREVGEADNEYWLVDDHSYKIYHIVDGQQRLTTFVIFLQSFIDFVRNLEENGGKAVNEIYITYSLRLTDVIERFLYKTKPSGDHYRTYKFGYSVDNPSYEYLRYRVFGEDGASAVEETFYTLNLRNAQTYFSEQLKQLYADDGLNGLKEIYKKLTKRFLFNEYVIRDEFDVFVAFETMNNRGKRLSDLELLKNRLIYLTTLYADNELDPAGHKSLRDAINSAWKEIYHQLGRNEKRPLNDDDFLRAHWIMYFQYSRKKGNDYINFLLNEQFSPHRVHNKIEREVALETVDEQLAEMEIDENEEDGFHLFPAETELIPHLLPREIKEYVNSLKECAVHWFNTHYPHLANGMAESEIEALERLNRIGMGYFRPLVMSILRNEIDVDKRVEIFDEIERFIFIVNRLSQARSNYRDSEFYNAARELNRGELTVEDIKKKLASAAAYCFREDGSFNSNDFYSYLHKKFNNGPKTGYYGWHGLRYFLYEYELNLLEQSRQKKVSWEDLQKTPKEKVSIEHIFPQTPTKQWIEAFAKFEADEYHMLGGSLGNLLLLSSSINSSLQNDPFSLKKEPKLNGENKKVRNGYADGSHSEIEVASEPEWTAETIEARGIRLLTFMEERWRFKFDSAEVKRALLFCPGEKDDQKTD